MLLLLGGLLLLLGGLLLLLLLNAHICLPWVDSEYIKQYTADVCE